MEKAEAFSYYQTHSLQLLTEGLAKISVEIRAALTKSNSDGVRNAANYKNLFEGYRMLGKGD